tara:strand:+ start:1813 stop:3714 length:1902 start_codon:yes stop_codon:yes gene_type:complete
MANNYTVSTFTTTETAGDSADSSNSFSNTMINSGTLTITPNAGYMVKASDFKVGSTLPDNIDSVVFTDSGTVGTLDNTVIATVSINRNFIMPSEDVTFNIDIDGATTTLDADELNAVVIIEDDKDWNRNFQTKDPKTRAFINASATITPSSGVTMTEIDNSIEVSPPPSRPKINYTLSTTVKPNVFTDIATVHVSADDNYHFSSKPYLSVESTVNRSVKMLRTKVTKDSDGFITDYYFTIKYKNNISTFVSDDIKAVLVYNTTLKKTITKEITRVLFGNSTIGPQGETRDIKIYGTPGAEFELTFSSKSASASILSSNNTNSSILDPVSGKLGSLKATIPETFTNRSKTNYYSFRQIFPSNIINKTLVNGSKTTNTTVVFDSTAGVKVGDQLFSNNRASVPIGTPVKVTSVNADGVTLVFDTPVTITDDSEVYFARAEEYYLNIEAGSDTTLGSTMPAVTPAQPATSDSVERRSYNYLFNQYINPVLKLTTSSADTVHLELNGAADIVYEGRVGISSTEIENIPSIPSRFNISYSLTPKGGHSTINELSSPTLKFSNKELTTTDSVGASVISSHWTNSVAADNGGTEIQIFNIIQSGTGTGTYTITAEVDIIKWGTKSVTMNLDLDQIIDTSA